MPVLMVRIEATADDSFAAMRARSRFGIAIAAMIRMIATTISSSISEKPFCLRIECVLRLKNFGCQVRFAFRPISGPPFVWHATGHYESAARYHRCLIKTLFSEGKTTWDRGAA